MEIRLTMPRECYARRSERQMKNEMNRVFPATLLDAGLSRRAYTLPDDDD